MSKVAYLISSSIIEGMASAKEMGWNVVSATRYATAEKQDVRLALGPGEIVAQELPTDVYRDKHWKTLTDKWPVSYFDELRLMCEQGRIRFANAVETDETDGA